MPPPGNECVEKFNYYLNFVEFYCFWHKQDIVGVNFRNGGRNRILNFWNSSLYCP